MISTINTQQAALTLCIFILGTCAGGFLNVLIYRLPKKIKIVSVRSFCPACGEKTMPCDLIPVISYLLLRGVCRRCGRHISPLYPVVELLTGLLSVISAFEYGYTLKALLFFSIAATLLTISLIDAKHMIIPDSLIISLAVFVLAYSVPAVNTAGAGMLSRGIGFFELSVPMLLLALLIPGAFGGGDIKLTAVCGFLLGAKLMLLAGFIAVILGGLYGFFIKYIKKDLTAVHIAFGQYICFGVFVAMTRGDEILRLYFSLFI